MHCDRCLREPDCGACGLTRLADLGLLGSDVQVVHAVHATTADLRVLADTGTHVSLSPLTEMRSMGFPMLTELLDAGVLVSLSVDSTAAPTNADLFGQMRALLSVEAARTGATRRAPSPLTTRRMLELATLDGARDLGVSDLIGSIMPGKCADLIGIRMSDLNLAPGVEPVNLVVLAAQPANVVTVIADDRVLKHDGRILLPDITEVAAKATESARRLELRAGVQIGRTFL